MSWFEWAFFLSLFSVFIIFSFVSFSLCIQTTQNRRISGISSIVFLFIAVFIAYYGIQRIESRIRERIVEEIIELEKKYFDRGSPTPKKETFRVFMVQKTS